MDRLFKLLQNFGNDEIKDIRCKGRLESNELCDEILYQTDGQYLYINKTILNKGQGKQTLHCPRCGKKSEWKRNPEFSNRANRFDPKFRSRF